MNKIDFLATDVDVLEGEVGHQEADVRVVRSADPRPNPPSAAVSKHKCRLVGAQAMELVDSLPFAEKRAAVQEAVDYIYKSPARDDPMWV